MQLFSSGRDALVPSCVRRSGWVFAAVCAIAVAGCSANGDKMASGATPRGATVAFESINGPPEGVFEKLVAHLNDEALAHKLPVVSRNEPSVYRVRGYLAAQKEGSKVSVSWVWDVYDKDQRRALRITGAETARSKSRKPWSVADDAMLKRIARTSMDKLAAFLTSPVAVPGQAPADKPAVVAESDDSKPEAFGIFRIFRTAKADPEPAKNVEMSNVPAITGPVPLPPRRPATDAAVSSAGTSTQVATR